MSKPVKVKNLSLYLDIDNDLEIDEGLIDTLIEIVNVQLSEILPFSDPKIVKQFNTTVKVIDLK